jgi:hypothetical protein
VGLKYTGSQKALKFKVHDTCDDIDGMTVVMEATEAESAKILAGECGEVISYLGDDKGEKSGFTIKMYMKISSSATSAALVTTAAPATADQADHGDDHGHGHDHGPNTNMLDAIHLFDGKTEGCVVLDTTYTGSDLMTGTSCKQVQSESVKDGKRSVGLKYMNLQNSLEFQVYEACDASWEGIGIEASEVESAKILAGECGAASLYLSEDKSFSVTMYMKIVPATSSPALATTDAPSADVVDHAERTNMVMPMLLVPLLLLAY